MIDFIKKKKLYVVFITVLFVFVSLSETTYSLFLKSDDTDEFNYNTGLLDLKFSGDEQIVLDDSFPMNDSDGIKTKPYSLTIKNTGNLTYLFDLKMVSSGDNDIDDRYIKVRVNDNLPQTLGNTNNMLLSNIILYPNEEITFKINLWLDKDLPNSEMGKTFTSKVVTSGSSIYKTIDNSGANHPKINNGMIPVYYDESVNTWKKADISNMVNDYRWYNYNDGEWANSVTIKNSDKYIFDINRKNDIKVDDLTVNNGNVVINDSYLEIDTKNDYDSISNILRVKFDDISNNIYIISNDKILYYYNVKDKVFTFKNGNNTVISNQYDIEKNKWYILGYTYDGNNISMYVDGEEIANSNINGNIGSSVFKLGTDNTNISKITVGNVLFYNRILNNTEIKNNYKNSFNIIDNGLVSGYSEFMPMTLREYYLASNNGININNDDIDTWYVWIPRFKYKVWNVLGEENIDTYNAYNNGIDIVFENNDSSSGTIYCSGINCYSDRDKTISVVNSDNDKYYTHIAFSNSNKELTGFWVSKYEIDDNKYLSSYYEEIKNIGNNYSVIKNTEWGAIAYLSHSKYGACRNNSCLDIKDNSTTMNIYGVFDMDNDIWEYTMGNISNTDNINLDNTNFKNTPISIDDYDLYKKDTFILGDATKEFSSSIDYNSEYNFYIRKGLFTYGTSNDIIDNNLTTRIVSR